MPKELSERRASDRQQMAKILAEIAHKNGAVFELDEILSNGKQVYFYIRCAHGLSASIDFSRDSRQADTHVIAWHFKGTSHPRLSDSFGIAAGGTVNSYHGHKCTGVCFGFEQLRESIEKCCIMAQNGTAFIQ